MNTKTAAKTAAKPILGSFETLKEPIKNQALGFAQEALSEFGFGKIRGVSSRPQELAQGELQSIRNKKKVDEMGSEDDAASEEEAQKLKAQLQSQYQSEYNQSERRVNDEQRELREEVTVLQEEVSKLANASGVETTAHMERLPKKIGVLDIKRLTVIVKRLRLKAEESKSGQDLVAQRSNSKRTTGMLAWVSGKQMKVHEQGTLTLQG